ncbi:MULTISPECIES: plasmid mobilization protein [Dysgonomonas]|uniref:plasmid mobilization protein n=1 Tax=Dysgonomonas TaxID=156973 RepID=UPI0009280A2A|nr:MULTISPECIES: plasmid mobilization relaxosome protein MobC [Dysgonomonas]MBN9300416.1 plasmid mobilization relaxosome protein MobC [Dysgonomonas mossii]OJX60599.1 MAG: mobilization protein [Dysgonomonas sp. 37-18]
MHDNIKNNVSKNRVSARLKEKVISVRVTTMEYLALKKRARDAGMSLSSFARSALLSAKVVQRIGKDDADTLRKLSGEANNLNQLARSANKDGFTSVAREITSLRNTIVDIINHLSDDWKNYAKSRF